jgi:hypothetical protein
MKKAAFGVLVLSLVMVVAATAHPDGTMTGWVVDEKCAAKVAKTGHSSEQCAKDCVKAGEKVVFVRDEDKEILAISNPDALQDHIGHHVSVEGTVDNGALKVENVKMAASKDSHEAEEHHHHEQNKEKHGHDNKR